VPLNLALTQKTATMITREFSDATNRWLGLLFAAVAFALFGLTIASFAAELEFFKTARRTTAVVTGLTHNWTWSSVRFTDAKGVEITTRTTTRSSLDGFIVGEEVEILHSEKTPALVKLNRWLHLWSDTIHTAISCLLLAGTAALTLSGRIRWGPLKQTKVFVQND
jgi:hypothetical protein